MPYVNIPVGISDFDKIREGEYYYIDKSGLIAEILRTHAEDMVGLRHHMLTLQILILGLGRGEWRIICIR